MSLELQKYEPTQQCTEPLNNSELRYLETTEAKERKVYYQVFSILMFMSFIIPFIGSWYRAYEGAENAFSPIRFFVSAGVLLFISSFATYMSYRSSLLKIQRDIKHKTKTIEKNHITRKLHIPTKNSFYFYIDSSIKLSIEVSQNDYLSMKEGDEVSIEYTTYSKHYLGYF